MTTLQKVIKYLAMALALFLVVSIISGILSVVGLFGGFFNNDAVTEDLKAYAVSADVLSLDVEINAADLTIKQGESFSVESNLMHLAVENKGGILTIKETKMFGSTYSGAVLTLYIPEGTVFEKANITTGAGRLTADVLSANALNLDLGAGEVYIGSLSAGNYADIDGGAGKITIADGTLNNLDLDMGVGQLNLTAKLQGMSEMDLGVGESNITLIGNKDDYTVDLDKGIGSIAVDGKTVSEYTSVGNGQNKLDIDGGVGAIHLNFTNEIQ